jgi:hypothetical protein
MGQTWVRKLTAAPAGRTASRRRAERVSFMAEGKK